MSRYIKKILRRKTRW